MIAGQRGAAAALVGAKTVICMTMGVSQEATSRLIARAYTHVQPRMRAVHSATAVTARVESLSAAARPPVVTSVVKLDSSASACSAAMGEA